MDLLKLNSKRVLSLLIIVNCYIIGLAQTKGVIVDSETLSPIPFVSIYTNGYNVKGTMGDKDGVYNISFKYDTIYFSHINYELKMLTKHSMNDTTFMNPTVHMMSDIIVTAQDNKWIEKLLKQFVKNKSKNYHTKDSKLSYTYNSKSLNDSSGYAFSSSGYMISPNYSEKEGYQICPIYNSIKYKDKTAGNDFMQLRRSVYNNFIKNFDNNFIKEYIFSLTSYKNDDNKNLLQFSFTSKEGKMNEGYIIMDTLKNVITEFEQVSGTNYNIRSNISSFVRFAASKRGFKYTVWSTTIRGRYSLIDGSYHLTNCWYQLFRQNEFKKGKKRGVYFTNIESDLSISKANTEGSKGCKWIKLPNPYSVVIAISKSTRLSEEALDRIPSTYELF